MLLRVQQHAAQRSRVRRFLLFRLSRSAHQNPQRQDPAVLVETEHQTAIKGGKRSVQMIALSDEIARRSDKRRREKQRVVVVRKQLRKLRAMRFDRQLRRLRLNPRNRGNEETVLLVDEEVVEDRPGPLAAQLVRNDPIHQILRGNGDEFRDKLR